MTTNATNELALTEIVDTQAYELETLQERLMELELALEDMWFIHLGDSGDREFSGDARKRIISLARLMQIKNPLIKRGVQVQVSYVWGAGCTMQAEDADIDAVVQAFLDDEQNQSELTSHLSREAKERELQTDGNIFFVLFPNALTGAVRVRTIPVMEIDDIVTNPEDRKDPWYYRRTWSETAIDAGTGLSMVRTRIAYYPDWKYTPRQKPPTIGRYDVLWENPVYHVKVGGYSDWKFGCSEVYAAIDWARAQKEFMEDWATFTRALSRYAHKLTTQGGKAGVAAAKARLGTTMAATTGGSVVEHNPPSTPGATWIGATGNDIQPMRIAGANVSMEDGRRLLLMVAAAFGLPEIFFGDAKVGNHATASTLDRPTELLMQARQALWTHIYQRLFDYVLLWAVKASRGPLRGRGTVIKTPDGDELVETVKWQGDKPEVRITFPPIVASDRKADVDAVVEIATGAGQPIVNLDQRSFLRMALTALGTSDVDSVVDDILEAMQEEQAQQAAQDVQAQAQAHARALELAQAQQPKEPPAAPPPLNGKEPSQNERQPPEPAAAAAGVKQPIPH